MDSLGDYIYLIVILIAGISSILGKRKKKREAEVETVDFPDLEDIIPEFTDYVRPEKPVYQEIKNNEAKVEIPTYDTVKDVSVMKAKKQVKPVKSFKELQPDELEVPNSYEIELDNIDEAKKAVIYSEIFNRKY